MERRQGIGRRSKDISPTAYVICLGIIGLWSAVIGACSAVAVVKFLQ